MCCLQFICDGLLQLLWCPHTAFVSSDLVKCTLRWFESWGRCWESGSLTFFGTSHWFWFERQEPLPPWDNLVRTVNDREYNTSAIYFFLAYTPAALSCSVCCFHLVLCAAFSLFCVILRNQSLRRALWVEQKVWSKKVGFKLWQTWSACAELTSSPDCLIWQKTEILSWTWSLLLWPPVVLISNIIISGFCAFRRVCVGKWQRFKYWEISKVVCLPFTFAMNEFCKAYSHLEFSTNVLSRVTFHPLVPQSYRYLGLLHAGAEPCNDISQFFAYT